MRKKLALAAALIHGPELLFLDEPFEGIDAVAKASLTALLADLVKRRGLTVFLTSHVLEVVERLCDHVGIIHRGRLVAQGSLADVVHAVPAAQTLTDAFVALVGEGRGGRPAPSFPSCTPPSLSRARPPRRAFLPLPPCVCPRAALS